MKLEATASRSLFLVVLALATISCGAIFGTEDPLCADFAKPALSVRVEHADTGSPIEGTLVTARVTGTLLDRRNVGFVDSARTTVGVTSDGDSVAITSVGAGVGGVYEVTAEKDGLRPWRREDVRVTEGECHVRTVHLTARLEPS